jgi:hypothetical protein
MKLINIEKTPQNSDKRFIATFCQCKGATKCLDKDRTKIKFGSKTGFTFIDGATDKTKENYLKRHIVNEDWTKINAGSLSRFILWSKKTLSQGIAEFKKRFNC